MARQNQRLLFDAAFIDHRHAVDLVPVVTLADDQAIVFARTKSRARRGRTGQNS
jgi:hypothetical protein